jgi:hypothetical protein
MAVSDPYVLATLFVVVLMVVLAFITKGRTRAALLIFPVSLVGVMLYFGLEMGVLGFQVGWFLFFPYLFAFCSFIFGFRTKGAKRVGFLTFAFLVTLSTLILDLRYLLPQIVQGQQILALKGIARFIFLATKTFILLCSGVIALVASLSAALVAKLRKRND